MNATGEVKPVGDIDLMTNEVLDWIRPFLPDDVRDPMHTCIKMTEEVSELAHALYSGEGSIAEECADILILLVDVAHMNGVDLRAAFTEKMERNRRRSWCKKNGALKHEAD